MLDAVSFERVQTKGEHSAATLSLSEMFRGKTLFGAFMSKWNVKSKRSRCIGKSQTVEHIVLYARRVVTWSYSSVLKVTLNGSGKGKR